MKTICSGEKHSEFNNWTINGYPGSIPENGTRILSAKGISFLFLVKMSSGAQKSLIRELSDCLGMEHVALHAGDTIEIVGTPEGREQALVDYIEVTPSNAP